MAISWLFLCLLAYRLFNALALKTFFQPDEYYQSLEPAHVLVFGYGFLPWEFREGIRSIVHPLLFAMPFKVLQLLGLDSSANVLLVPKLIGTLQAATTDFYTVRFVHKTWGRSAGWWSLLVTTLSPWNFYVGPRTFSNSLETTLTAYALYKWPFAAFRERLDKNEVLWTYYTTTALKALAAAGASALIRPTAALLWLVPGFVQLKRYGMTFGFEAFYAVYVTLQFSLLVDSFYYGKVTWTLINFLMFNLRGFASFYGVNQVHYYFSQGLPLLLCAWLPFALHGTIRTILYERKQHGELLAMCAVVIAAYTCLQHKEVRFIAPLSIILNGFAAYSLDVLWRTRPFPSAVVSRKGATPVKKTRSRAPIWVKLALFLTLAANIVLGYYVGFVHQRGVVNLIEHVRVHPEIDRLLLLMPCHSTPWQSHMHREGQFRFLTCEPPLSGQPLATYRDEADQFYDSPLTFLSKQPAWSGWVATFEATQPIVEQFWDHAGVRFDLERRWFNTHAHDDARRRGDVLLYRVSQRITPVE